ncbi:MULTISPECIES: aromatic/alkene monooxygenase hydroxylase subunit beta [Methylomonas]|uniref:Methane monooxygenase n=1 Tax=Methylomonas koyamae TaxID=702114 RepID=A0A177NLB0_9GAMM|nr:MULTISPECIES: aromatic/alkene monooxygenase hydroxylase subunit beta [Methylomonas]OAI18858.1 methane monooxygenase [Methylomonas koyamae]OHX34195.1 methane monooxygenase [Methylomonas sp. LWB]WGS86045.1 aromatic/alkene monooxygenase hydroxylase subunit beta [Methylomonas sp. UP202]
MSVQVQQGKRGLTDPEMVKEILEAIPDQPLDTQRKMNYFVKPRGRRLTEYEVLTCYAQPTPDWIPGGLDWGDWTQKFHGGRPSWGNETTELHSTDWHKHRDPAKRWHAPYVKDKAEEWRYTDRFLLAYSSEGQVRSIDPIWRDEVLNDYLGAFCFNEYGLFNAHSSASRDCLGDTLRMSIAMIGFDKVDNAQMIQLERTFLAKLVPGFPESTDEPKREWTQGAIYKGARETVQDIWQATYDWNEILWSCHMVYDPLFGQFVRREFFQRLSSYYGDTLTPFFINQMQLYFSQTKGITSDMFFECLGDDAEFGDYNRRMMRAWTDKWLPRTVQALQDFMGIFTKIPTIPGVTSKDAVEAALERVFDDWKLDYADKVSYKFDKAAIIKTILQGLK